MEIPTSGANSSDSAQDSQASGSKGRSCKTRAAFSRDTHRETRLRQAIRVVGRADGGLPAQPRWQRDNAVRDAPICRRCSEASTKFGFVDYLLRSWAADGSMADRGV